ncbi:MAG TPA: hypothetical protein DHV36_15760 [Desulfobacteraceae bacterium]|mgnify:CR=1 FL=1|nr:hypothetical protein [Desulfobacteraceae bacterium]
MPGLKIKIDTATAEKASVQLRKELKFLGSSAIDNEKDFKKLESRLHKGMAADKAGQVIEKLRKSMNLTRMETAKLQREIGDTSGAIKTMILGNNELMHSFGALAGAAGIGFGIIELANFTGAAIQSASDLQEVSSKYEVVFKGQTEMVNQWASNLVEKYAMSARESKQYLSSIQDLLVPMGMEAAAAANLSKEIVKLSADLGSFNNLPTQQVIENVQSALVGEYEAMKKYGIVLNQTRIEQKALNMGLADTKKELTLADKAQAAYKLMLESSAAAIGDMERTSLEHANTTKRLSAEWEDFSATLGQKFLPAATSIKGITADILDNLTKAMQGPSVEDQIQSIQVQLAAMEETEESQSDIVVQKNKAMDAYIKMVRENGGLQKAAIRNGRDSKDVEEGILYVENKSLTANERKKKILQEQLDKLLAIKNAMPDSYTDYGSPSDGLGDDDEEDSKKANDIAKAYAVAYSGINGMTQGVYDKMLARFKEERNAFISLTGDKETAFTLYYDKLDALNEKTMAGLLRTEEDWVTKANTQARIDAIRAEEAEMAASWERRIQAENDTIAKEKTAWESFQQDYKRATLDTTAYQLDQLNQQYDHYAKFIEDKDSLDRWYAAESKRITEETTETWKDAFSGWAISYASTLNDMVWGAEASFGNIAESFGKMVTQMMIQKQMLKAMDWADGFDLGSIDIGSGNFDPFGWISFHTGGIVGAGEGGVRHGINPAVFNNAPKYHTGLMPDEFPAILQKGEGVFTEGQMAALGAATQGGSSRSVSITFGDINVKPTGDPAYDQSLANNIAQQIKQEVKQVIADEKRVGGLLNNSLSRGYA